MMDAAGSPVRCRVFGDQPIPPSRRIARNLGKRALALDTLRADLFSVPARARLIATMAIEIERIRNAIASLTAEVERIDSRLQYLTHDRQPGVMRDALAILRRAGAPMGIRALTIAVMTERDQDSADGAVVKRNMEKLRVALTNQRRAGVVRRGWGPGRTVVWSVAA
jgi:hypothetical protein